LQRRYAVLGWGSLIWDLENLAPHVRLPWSMGAGPRLPMEFSRISAKRKMGLVACLDPEIGVPCPTHAIASLRGGLDGAIGDLALRERAPRLRIGGVCLATGKAQGRAAIVATVRDWCRAAGWTGAVWTDLLPNYAEAEGEPFSVERGMAYLRRLSGDGLDEAVRYIRNAPPETDTPLRRRLAGDPWWLEQAARVGSMDRAASEAAG
jgi:hypothetical protein